MDNFYMTLPSNVKSSIYTNTVANYRTKLAHRLELEGDWEVGLSTISYTNSWYNLTHKEYIKFLYFVNGQFFYLPKPAILRRGSYQTIEKLLEAINLAIKEVEDKENSTDRMKHR